MAASNESSLLQSPLSALIDTPNARGIFASSWTDCSAQSSRALVPSVVPSLGHGHDWRKRANHQIVRLGEQNLLDVMLSDDEL